MEILLDIDDTLINHKDVLHSRYKELFDEHDVILYSASEDIKKWAKRLKVDYISKHSEGIPEAEVLIDDDKQFLKFVKVQHYFPSINSFLEFYNNK